MALALSNEHKEEQLKRYQRIVVIEPKHPEAKRQKPAILNRREIKKQQRIETIKIIYDKYFKKILYILGFILALLIFYN